MASEDKEKTEWHRLIGMILYAVFIRLRYMTEVEVDLASQRQLVDYNGQQTQNPVLGLFSGKPEKVFASYDYLRQHSDLLDEVSIYFEKIAAYYGKEMVNMYTKEDFWRDYPPHNQPFAFPWEEEYHQRVIEQVRQEVRDEVRDEVGDEERRATARTMRDLGMDYEVISKVTGLTSEEIQAACNLAP